MTFEIQEFTYLSPMSNWSEIFRDTSLGGEYADPINTGLWSHSVSISLSMFQ